MLELLTTEGYVLCEMSGDHENRWESQLYYSTNREKLENICKILQYKNDEFSSRYRKCQSEIYRYLKFYTDKFGHDEGISKEDFDKFLLNNPIPSYISEFILTYKMSESCNKNGEPQYHIETIDLEHEIDKYYYVSELDGDKNKLEELLNEFTIEEIDEIINENNKQEYNKQDDIHNEHNKQEHNKQENSHKENNDEKLQNDKENVEILENIDW